jgi:hypothetical protein
MSNLLGAKTNDNIFTLLSKQNALLGGSGATTFDNEFTLVAKNNNLIQAGGTGGGGGGGSTAQIYAYDDFIQENAWNSNIGGGLYPGLWVAPGGSVINNIGNSGSQNGVISLANGNYFDSNFCIVTGSKWPAPYANISKIVLRAVISYTGTPAGSSVEIVIGFNHTGTAAADGSNNLYGAFVNFCPGYGGLPDWTTRAILTAGQLNGLTYGVYGGQAVSQFGYKPSGIVTAVALNHWYDVVISMVPGVSCTFYVANYGSVPVLDQNCTVTALVPGLSTAGPIITAANSSGGTPNLLIDKLEYGIWLTEGNKQLGSALNNF